jgi:hypothetical protein
VSIIPSPLLSASAATAANVEVIAVRYTLEGDLNLDGVVDADDYFRIDSGFLGGARTYSEGDVNYDGRVDADDYFLVDSTFLKQVEGAAATANAPAGAVVTRMPTFSRERINVTDFATRKRNRLARRGSDVL